MRQPSLFIPHGGGPCFFLNPDGSRVAILHRTAGEGPVTIALAGTRYELPLSSGSVATVRWSGRGRQ